MAFEGEVMSEVVELTEEEEQKIQQAYKEVVETFEKEHRIVRDVKEPPKVTYCMAIYEERMAQVKQCIERVRPFVDRCIIVIDDTVTDENKKWLTQWGCEIHYRKWDNHFSKQRNAYLEPMKEGDWCLVSDPDELFSESLMFDLKTILFEAEKAGINSLCINAHDITTQLDGEVTTTVSNWFKQLLFKYEEGVRYVGIVHETLLPGIQGWRPVNLMEQYYYEHFKSIVEIKERGARNVFCGGGGNNVKERNPVYIELHEIADRQGIKDWPTLRNFLRNPLNKHLWREFKEVAIKHRNDSGWDYENESRDLFLWLKAIHPEEFREWESTPQPPSLGSPPEIMAYIEEQYLKILGRNADDYGKQAYTDAILRGTIKREDLPNILQNSKEYKDKHGL